ncbi:hypothetical protein GCM10009678_22490 [Actinomadura kijaniata]
MDGPAVQLSAPREKITGAGSPAPLLKKGDLGLIEDYWQGRETFLRVQTDRFLRRNLDGAGRLRSLRPGRDAFRRVACFISRAAMGNTAGRRRPLLARNHSAKACRAESEPE